MSLFALCFVVKSVLLLIANWVSDFTVPVIVFALLEQIPTAGTSSFDKKNPSLLNLL